VYKKIHPFSKIYPIKSAAVLLAYHLSYRTALAPCYKIVGCCAVIEPVSHALSIG